MKTDPGNETIKNKWCFVVEGKSSEDSEIKTDDWGYCDDNASLDEIRSEAEHY